jgi:alpha-L-fucosidase 2
MLLQSHETEARSGKSEVRVLDLLPALPKAWADGSVNGLCGRGGFEVAMSWKEGRLVNATVHSLLGNPCKVRAGDKEVELQTKRGKVYEFNAELKRVAK